MSKKDWFAVQVDRDFETIYGDCNPRLYIKNMRSYVIINRASYDKDKNVLKVWDEKNKEFVLDTEPDQEWFESSVYAHWKSFDEQFGKMLMDDRSDYEPWSYNSIKSLAIELKQHTEDNIIRFYGKKYLA